MTMIAVPEHATAPPEIHLKEYWEVLRKRRNVFINVFISILVVGIAVSAVSKPVYQTQAKLLVPAGSPSVSILDSSNPIATMLAAAQPDSMGTQLQVLQSVPFLDEAKQKAGVHRRTGVVPPAVRVEALKDSNILQVTVEGGDPKEIAMLANTIVDLHLEKTDLLSTTGLRETLDFVRRQKEQTGRDLEIAGQKLLAFRRDHRVVELTARQESEAKEFVAVQARVHETENNLRSMEAQLTDLRARIAKEPLDLVQEAVQENPRRAKLATKIDDLKVQRAELLQDFLPKSERIRAADERIAGLIHEMDAEPETARVRTHSPNPARPPLQVRLIELEADLQGNIAAHNAAAAMFAAQRGIIDNLGPWEVQHSRLTHDRDALQKAYDSLSDRLRDLEIRAKARFQIARAIEKAGVPTSPIRPRKSTNFALAAVLALCLAAGTVFLQETLDDRVNTPEDLERLTTTPTLGHVPLIATDQPHLVAAMPAKSPITEAYRALRSAIGFAAVDAPLRRLLITSPSKGEGKSVTSLNLAAAMAMDGKRVLLIDADLRRPNLHKMLGLPLAPGLSEVLAGTQVLTEAIHQTEVPNLRVLCGGTIPPNPAELIGAQNLDGPLAQLKNEIDIVIFDSPPCIPVIDSLILAAQADGVVLVVHSGETRKGAVTQALEKLTRAHARVVGIVLNQVQPHKVGYYYHHYYSYGEPESERVRHRAEHRHNGHEREAPSQNGRAVALTSRADEGGKES